MNAKTPQPPATRPRRPFLRTVAVNSCVSAAALLATLVTVEILMRLTGFAATDWYSGGPGNRALDARAQRNSLGFRDRDYPNHAPPGTVRILILGDSFAWGAGVTGDNAIFPALLEENLNRAADGPRVQVLNASLKGANTWKEADLYRHAHQEFKPDIVAQVFFVNDVETPAHSPLFAPLVQPALPWIPGPLRDSSYLAHFLELRVRLVQERTGRRMNYARYLHALYADPQTLSVHERAMDSLAREVRADGARLVVVNLPVLHPGPYAFPAATRHIRAQAARLHAPFLDLAPELFRHDPANLRISRFDAHLNETGHRLTARILTRKLEPLVRDAAAHVSNQN